MEKVVRDLTPREVKQCLYDFDGRKPICAFNAFTGVLAERSSKPLARTEADANQLNKYVLRNDWLRGCSLIERVLRTDNMQSVEWLMIWADCWWRCEAVGIDGTVDKCYVFNFGVKGNSLMFGVVTLRYFCDDCPLARLDVYEFNPMDCGYLGE